MSTEKLTAEQSLKIYKIRASAMGDSISADEADGFIAGYRAAQNEVEHQTKQLKEEREALKLVLQRLLFYLQKGTAPRPGTLIYEDAKKVINQLNQNNEG